MEFMLSSPTNPSRSTFTVRWDQVGVFTEVPAETKALWISEPWEWVIGQSKQTSEAYKNRSKRFCKSFENVSSFTFILFSL